MKHLGGTLTAALVLSLAWHGPAPAQVHSDRDLVVKVRKAIDRGVEFLRRKQQNNGSWEVDLDAPQFPGGRTALALVALLNAGVARDDPMIQRGLKYLRTVSPDSTYVRALQTMAFAEAGNKEDLQRVQENVDWLMKARVLNGGELRGWGYSLKSGFTDNSNSQYAVLGLYAGRHAGAVVPREVWEGILKFYQTTQMDDGPKAGAWDYSKNHGVGPRLTMTTAGLSGLLMAGMELNDRREKPLPDGSFSNCGKYDENPHVQRALTWVGRHFNIPTTPHVYYNLYGIERAGRLSGERFFGSVDWYREGCEFLTAKQSDDGSWNEPMLERWPVVCTSFSLLFLAKGRTPILITKMVHGPYPNRGTDWNNDRNDLRHLVDYTKEKLFRKRPLGWQIFDAMRPLVRTEQDLNNLVGELLPSPIVYFNGHQAPRFTEREKEVLKRYVENGGFLLAEACCGAKGFRDGVGPLLKELFGDDNKLTELKADHPVWKAFFPVPPGSFKLQGIQMGCKTVVIYSPEDLSCSWENNDTKSARGELAFRMGVNIVAYATGREPPPDRLTPRDVLDLKDEQKVPRGFLKVAQLRFPGDWQPAPRAMPILMKHLREKAKLNVTQERADLAINDPSLSSFPVLYMHGRGNFEFSDKEVEKLRFHLEHTGGLLLADSCCGKEAFDQSFRRFVKQVFPKHALQPIPKDDELFSKELNTVQLNEQTIRCRRLAGGEFQPTAPLLEGIKIDDRWVVIYSKYDLGCALERHQSSDCLGYDHASALRIGSAVVFYMLRP